jgi:succinate-semialdehyde dehydrogenase/glutarate-semialdehyde dehydrogenase
VESLARRTAALRVGSGLDEATDLGPLIDDAAVAKVQAHIADAVDEGGTILTGGHPGAQGGTYFQPTVIAGVTGDMLLTKEETFGPLAGVMRFDDEDEVIALANDSEFGLAAYMYTNDLSRTWRVAEALETGMVGINTGLISTEVAPFGGVKQSGLGREGSRHGLEDYVELKYLCMQV